MEITSERPGYAIVDLGVDLGLDHFRFSLRRQADGRFLGAEGRWHPSVQTLSPQKLLTVAGTTRFTIGPTIVNAIDEEESMQLNVQGTHEPFSIIWPALSRSSTLRGDADPFGTPATDSTIDGVETRKKEPSPPPDEVATEPPPLEETPPRTTEPEPPPIEPEPPPVDPVPPPPFWDRYKVPILVLVAALLVAAAGVSYALRPAPPMVVVTPPAPDPDVTILAELRKLREELKTLVSERGDVGRIADAAKRLLESGRPEFQQDGLRALFAAASRGSADAQLALAKVFDPRYFQSGNSAVPSSNPKMSVDQYSQAEQGGSILASQAGDELRGLCAFLRQRGASEPDLPQRCPD